MQNKIASSFLIFLLYFVPVYTAFPAAPGEKTNYPETGEWKLTGPVRSINQSRLHEEIYGAADMYLKYGCEELQIIEYEYKQKFPVSVQVFRFKTSIGAFGLYSRERPRNGDYSHTGVQAFFDDWLFAFFTDRYYVKINTMILLGTDQSIEKLASDLAGFLSENHNWPEILDVFPDEGKIANSEQYIPFDFMGNDFFCPAFTADYILFNEKFTLFILQGINPGDCEQTLDQYLSKIKSAAGTMEGEIVTVTDPYFKDISLLWTGNNILGIRGLSLKTQHAG